MTKTISSFLVGLMLAGAAYAAQPGWVRPPPCDNPDCSPVISNNHVKGKLKPDEYLNEQGQVVKRPTPQQGAPQ